MALDRELAHNAWQMSVWAGAICKIVMQPHLQEVTSEVCLSKCKRATTCPDLDCTDCCRGTMDGDGALARAHTGPVVGKRSLKYALLGVNRRRVQPLQRRTTPAMRRPLCRLPQNHG
eukprot:352735-Chlamydomonas_euryale.AAC.7